MPSNTAYAQAPSTDTAQAQSTTTTPNRGERFFSPKISRDQSGELQPSISGSLTLSSFAYSESGDNIKAGEEIVADNASTVSRVFAEGRAQIDIRNLGSDTWSARIDGRGRFAVPCDFITPSKPDPEDLDEYDDCRTQSGTFGENEYEVRELYARYRSGGLDIHAGRQFVAEIASIKVDGVRAKYDLNRTWSVLGFAGLYPSRISRSVDEDYAGSVFPVVAGLGTAYRYQRYFGAVGAAGILPNDSYTDPATGMEESEDIRTLVTSNGFWRPADSLDVYHLAIVDLTGAAGAGITNANLGINYRPVRDLRLSADVSRIDTETLDAFARQKLEDPVDGDIIQNNAEVTRIASDAARVGLSVALSERRFEVSTSFQLRQREAVDLCNAMNADMCQTLDAARAGEVRLAVLDRRSLADLRLGASVSYSYGLGDNAYRNSEWLLARLHGSRAFIDDRLQLDLSLSYLMSEDKAPSQAPDNPTLIGQATVDSLSASTNIYYRVHRNFFAFLTASGGLQSFQPGAIGAAAQEDAATNTFFSGFLRLAYRF